MIFLPGIVLAALMVLLLGQKQPRAVAHYVLAGWLGLMALHQTLFLVSYEVGVLRGTVGIVLGYCLAVAHTPLLYVYAYAATQNRLPPRVWLHGTPYFLLAGTLIAYHLRHPNVFVFQYGLLLYRGNPPWWIRHNGSFIALVALAYNAWTFRLVSRHARTLSNQFSYREGITLGWLRNWLIGASLFFVLVFAVIVSTVTFRWMNRAYTFWWVGLFMTAYIFVLSYFGFRQTTLFVRPLEPEKPEADVAGRLAEPSNQSDTAPRYKNSSLSAETMDRYSQRIAACLQTTNLYLDENLTLADLAEKTGIPPHHLSQTLNVSGGQSFFELINHYRLEEVKRRLPDPRYHHLTILGIAYDCGFKSKSAFNALFKKHTGLTPSAYKKKGSD